DLELSLESGLSVVEEPDQMDGEGECDERCDQRGPAQDAVVAGHEHQHRGADGGEGCHPGQDRMVQRGTGHLPTPTRLCQSKKATTAAPPAATQAAYERMLPDCMRRNPSPISLETSPAPLTAPSITF